MPDFASEQHHARATWNVAMDYSFIDPTDPEGLWGFDFDPGGANLTKVINGATFAMNNVAKINIAEIDAGGLGLHFQCSDLLPSADPALKASIGFDMADFPAMTDDHEIAAQMVISVPGLAIGASGQWVTGCAIRDASTYGMIAQEWTFGGNIGVRPWRFQGTQSFGGTPTNVGEVKFLEAVRARGGNALTFGDALLPTSPLQMPGVAGHIANLGVADQEYISFSKVPQGSIVLPVATARIELAQTASTVDAITSVYVERIRVLYRLGNP